VTHTPLEISSVTLLSLDMTAVIAAQALAKATVVLTGTIAKTQTDQMTSATLDTTQRGLAMATVTVGARSTL
jgi:hypothetical protein